MTPTRFNISDLQEFDSHLQANCCQYREKLREMLGGKRLTLAEVRTHRVLVPMIGVYTPGWQALPACSWEFVELVTNEGPIGTGEWSIQLDGTASSALDRIRAKSDKNLLDLDLEIPLFMAWWDLVGQALEKPLVNLWAELFDVGFTPPRQVPLAAYSWQRFPDRHGNNAVTFENWPEFCKSQVEREGYRHLKLSMTSYQPEDHVSIIERIRDAVGPNVIIRIDPHGSWNFQEAKRISRDVEPYDIEYIEEPINSLIPCAHIQSMPAKVNANIGGFQYEYYYRKLETLRDHTTIPISCHWWTPPIIQPGNKHHMTNKWEFNWYLMERYDPVDISNPDIGLGVFGIWRLFQMARFTAMHVTLHSNFELGLQTSFRAAMMSALGYYPETHGIYMGTAPRLCHSLDTEYNQVSDDVLIGGKIGIIDGHIPISSHPGHGLKLDSCRLREYAYSDIAVQPHRAHAQHLYREYRLDRPRRTTLSGWPKSSLNERCDQQVYPYDVACVLGVEGEQRVDVELNS